MDRRDDIILSIRDLVISFRTTAGIVHAIRGVNIDVPRGKTVAIVGESGSGKSVSMKSVIGIQSSNSIVESGTITFNYEEDGERKSVDLLKLSEKEMRTRINGSRIAMVFQDPMTTLDPTMSIGAQIVEGMRLHSPMTKKEAYARAVELLNMVGIAEAEKRIRNYPHQLSGGMRQRVVIAIAMACNPDLLICDEPTTALDVTIQARILDLIQSIQAKTGISVVYITHDLGVVAKVADEVAVMYAGKIVEKGTADDIFYDPRHPYTWGLLSAMPDLNTSGKELYMIPGSPPDLLGEIRGDAFAPRNRYALRIDLEEEPPMFQVSETHYAATWLLDERAPHVEMPRELREQIRLRRERN